MHVCLLQRTTVKRDVYTSLLMCVKEAYIRHMYVCYRGFYIYVCLLKRLVHTCMSVTEASTYMYVCQRCFYREVGGWGRDPFSRNFIKPTPRRKWYLTTGRRFH